MNQIQKKQTLKYTFTVEGHTEKWYLEWLENKINAHPKAEFNVDIDPKRENPSSFGKITTKRTTPEIVHLCDIESNCAEHKKKFENILSELNTVKKHKGIDYGLGYSNYTFELWMILHKIEFQTPLTDRNQYLQFVNKAFGNKYNSIREFKSKENFKSCLEQLTIDNVIDAIKRSEKIEKDNERNGFKPKRKYGFSYYEENPSLSIHKFIKKILTQCGIMK